MAIRKYTEQELQRIIEVVNEYPGNYTYAAGILSTELNRSANAILRKFRTIKKDYLTPCVVSASGKRTPSGVTRWNSDNVPNIRTIRRWQNIKHLFF